jgi:PKD repeat protein
MRIYLVILLALFSLVTRAQTSFSDQSSNLFYPFVNSGAPMGVADMNGDGLDDIIRIDNGSTIRFDYQPSTGGAFTGISLGQLQGSQWGMCIADADKNGYNDLFTGGAYNGLKFYLADDSGTSYDVSIISMLPIFLQGANFADIDIDGDVDIFACNDVGLSHAYNNDGSGDFSFDSNLINTSSTVPSDNSGNYGSVWTDYDSDGDLDLYISKCRQGVTDPNDGRRINLLFENDGEGNYMDVAEEAGLIPYGQSWATDFADIDNDGDMDCFVINHDIASNLYINNGDNYFTDVITTSGMAETLATAGNGIQVKFVDFDNDTYVDLLFSSNGANHLLFKNNGDQTFALANDWIPTDERIHSFSTGDLNNDGFVDFIAGFGNGFNTPNNLEDDKLFINNGNDNHYLKVRLEGDPSNKNGVGARLEIYGAWGTQIREIRSGESYGITTSLTAHFGLGASTEIDSLIVKWPSGYVDQINQPNIDQTIVLEEGSNCVAVADFDTEVSGSTVTFNDQSSLGTTTWFWNFGDGTMALGENQQHTYAATGIYEVCLTISGDCGTIQNCKDVNVNCSSPTGDFFWGVDEFDASFTSIVSGTANSFVWDFGDGTGVAGNPNPQHTYSAPGIYTVCLDLGSPCGSFEICHDIAVNCAPPGVGFNALVNQLTIAFTDESSPEVTQWLWDFGDGTTSTEENPTHTFPASDTYIICLTVTSECGSNQVCLQATLNCAPPTPGFQAQVNQLTIAFTDTSSPDATGWLWDFGDGTTSTEQSPTHVFAAGGTYTICLTASSECGSTQVCLPITVNCSPPSAGFQAQVNQLTVDFSDNSSPGVTDWLWNFDDGTASVSENPTHTFPGPGTYNVCLTVTNSCGSNTVCLPITVNCAPPSVDFQAQIQNLTTNFFNNSSPDVTQWAWDFGDGNTSILENPTHTYAAPGTYVVCLTGTSICGSQQVCTPITATCAPPAAGFASQINQLTVTLSDNSDPAVTQWQWNFGDGNTSTLQNPSHTYAAPGTYTICLTVTSSCGTNQICIPVTVNCASPSVGFQMQTNGLTVSLTDNSSPEVTQWFWDFNDGTTSSDQNPTHTYSNAGTYIICLTGTSICGSSQVCLPVTASCTPPSVGFDVQVNQLTVNITDNSSADVIQWLWDFGDGNTSSEQSPTYTYAQEGTYTICLTGTSSCSSSQVCLDITTSCATPIANFILQTNLSTVILTDISSASATAWFWDFGDGSTSTLQNPTHTYTASGTYTICLVASSDCGADQTCQQVIIECAGPAANFTVQPTNFTVNFTDASSNQPSSWFWDFGDGTISTQQDPVHIYSQIGAYTVCLTVTNACGQNTICQEITITCPAPQSIFSTQSDGFTANFTDISNNQPSTWSWNFGDGNSSNLQNPSHTYAVEGLFTVCLTVTNNCGENSYCETITITCAEPEAAFSSENINLTVSFSDNSINQPTSWQWNFGDGNTSTAQNPAYTYFVPGSYTVCLTVTNSCGSDQICQQVVVTCAVPQANFMYQEDELTVNFLDFSTNQPISWLWDFSDGNTSSAQNPSYSFALPGTYTVCLTASSVCGSNQVCQQIVITCEAPQSGFIFQTNDLIASFTDNSTNQPTSWLWNFGDGTSTSTLQNPTHAYVLPGTYTVCLTSSSVCGTTQVCQEVTTNCPPPIVGFDVQINELSVNFTDNSSNDATQWLWDFGDGNSSSLQNPTHTYSAPGTYTVCLTASSDCGSTQECLSVTATCTLPTVGYSVQIDQLSVSFTDNSDNDVITWLWDFGDGNTSTLQNPTHTYSNPGMYTVCLTGTSICGSTQVCQAVAASCGLPSAGFNALTNQLTVNFNDNSSDDVTQWLWDFGDGNTSVLENPVHTYFTAGTYVVCLTATSACGSNQTCQNITVTCSAPQAGYTFLTNELAATFNDISTNNPTQWFWDFGDGNFSTDQFPTHTYASPGAYTVCLTASSNCGNNQACDQVIVTCTPPQAAFEVETNNYTAIFTDNSTNAPSQWLWDFGDGNTSSLANPVHEYVNSGTYTICLTVSSACGNNQTCQTITVDCQPPEAVFAINGSGLEQIFQDVSTNNPESWLWDFGDGSISEEQNPFYTFAEPGSYNVCLTVSNACGTNTDCHLVFLMVATENPELDEAIQLSPNPASSYIQLNFDLESPLMINLYLMDTKGRRLSKWAGELFGKSNNIKTIDVGDLPSGLYYIVIETEGGIVVKRFMRM